MACPNVLQKILETKKLLKEGNCWCDCVKEDIPKAEKLVKDGKCGAANSVVEAALRRCDRQPPTERTPVFEIKPIPLMELP